MRTLIGLLLFTLATASAGCAWTPAERTAFRDKIAKETADAAVAMLKEKIAPKVKEKVAEIIGGIVEKLDVDDETKKKILNAAIEAINEGIDKLFSGEVVGAKLEKAFRDLLDKILPKADPETSGTGRVIGSILLAIVTGGVGLKPGG